MDGCRQVQGFMHPVLQGSGLSWIDTPFGPLQPTPSPPFPGKELFPVCCSSSWSCCLPSPSCPKSKIINPGDAQGREWLRSLLGLSEMKDCGDFTGKIIHGNLSLRGRCSVSSTIAVIRGMLLLDRGFWPLSTASERSWEKEKLQFQSRC